MASLTQEALRDRVLEHLGVKGANISADANDASMVDEAVDSAYKRLRRKGLAPYALSAIPDWAQSPLRDFVAAEVAGSFGIDGQRLQLVLSLKQGALDELGSYTQSPVPNLPTKAEFF